MFADKTLSPEWLRIQPLPTSGHGAMTLGSATPVPESANILNIVTFEEWDAFDADAASISTILKDLPSDDENRISISRTLQRRNLRKVSINRRYKSERKLSTLGAEDASQAFAAIIEMASDAFFIPELRRGLLCEPWEIYPKPCEYIYCSKRIQELCEQTTAEDDGNSSQVVDGIQTGNTTVSGVTRKIVPDLSVYKSRDEQGTMPILTVEGKRPALQFAKELGLADESTESVAQKFKRLFGRVRTGHSELKDREVVLCLAVCQALVYGLQTESECAVLTNFNETIFLKLVEVKNEGRKELKVGVSRLYDGGSVFCGVVACLKKLFSEDYSTKVEGQGRIEFLLSLCEDDPDYEGDEGADHPDDSEGSSGNQQTPSADKKRRVRGPTNASANMSPFEENACQTGSPNSVILASREKKLPGRVLSKIINQNLGYLSEFGYNLVLKCRMNDRIVAAKFFHSLEEKRVSSTIDHERYMHSLMETRCEGGKYGDFVGELVAYGNVKAFGIVLMTEYVGKAVTRLDSQVLVGGEVVFDVNELCTAAIRSLRRIHELKLLHGDVSLSNIRAQEIGQNGWQVWWIDFGDAKECESDAAFRREERACRELFQRGERRLFE